MPLTHKRCIYPSYEIPPTLSFPYLLHSSLSLLGHQHTSNGIVEYTLHKKEDRCSWISSYTKPNFWKPSGVLCKREEHLYSVRTALYNMFLMAKRKYQCRRHAIQHCRPYHKLKYHVG